MAHPGNLPTASHFITTNSTDASSVFQQEIPEIPHYKPILPSASTFADLHISPTIPTALDPSSPNNDLAATQNLISTNTRAATVPISPPGAVFRRTDTPPGQVSPMHRTLSVDYGIVLEGSIELTLESGEKRILQKGDTVVQRATMHQWRNPSETEWCRMVFVMIPCEELVVGGKALKEEFRILGKA